MSTLNLSVFTAPAHVLPDGESTFSPTTATIITGESDAVLVDTTYLSDDVRALGDRIEATGRRLTAIYITHAHPDHYHGMDALTERFPSARVVAAPEVAQDTNAGLEQNAERFGRRFFAELGVAPKTQLEALPDRTIDLEGHELVALPAGQADISPTAALYVPSLKAVVAGDSVYNDTHVMLALGGPDEWAAWIDYIDLIAELDPEIAVAGHKNPESADDAPRQIAETRRYVQDFAEAVRAGGSTQDVVATISSKYPHFGNITTLQISAFAATNGGPSAYRS